MKYNTIIKLGQKDERAKFDTRQQILITVEYTEENNYQVITNVTADDKRIKGLTKKVMKDISSVEMAVEKAKGMLEAQKIGV